jgi:hypothetical protein
MILIAAAGIVGGICSFAALTPFGWVPAVLGMPFGGSLSAAAAACLIAYRQARHPLRPTDDVTDPVPEMEGDARPA